MSKITAIRYHDISAGHRVVGHENKCRSLHGHNYRIHFHCEAPELDHLGRVIDFGVIKSKLCMWVEENWDHKMLLWRQDPVWEIIPLSIPVGISDHPRIPLGVHAVPFNPTAENLAKYLVQVVGPAQLEGSEVVLKKVVIEETRKCSASYEIKN
jgi:6-pyruvoyltetrahydropterin/6-carboxytetrahydropterin synthase